MKIQPKKKNKLGVWLKKHKAIVISTSAFLLVGLIGLLIGFEIKENGHAIRKFLASPSAATLIIMLVVGIFLVVIIILSIIYMKKGDE